MLGALLPTLTALRKQEQALATVTAAAGSDPSFASGLLTAGAALHSADGTVSTAASSDLTAVEQQGLAVVFYPGNDPAGPPGVTADATGVLAYGPGLASQLPLGSGPSAGVWAGYLTAPQDGGYYIAVAADPGAVVTLDANGTPVPGTVTNNAWQNTAPVQLVAGQLTPVTLTVTGLQATLSVSWQGPGLGWQLIPGQYLYSGTLVGQARRHLHPVPQGRLAGGRAVADRGGDRLPRDDPVTDGERELAQRPGRDGRTSRRHRRRAARRADGPA